MHILLDAVLVVREGAKILFCREAVYECEGRVFPSYQETPADYVILKRRDLQLQVSESVNNRLCVYKAAITVLFHRSCAMRVAQCLVCGLVYRTYGQVGCYRAKPCFYA